MKRRSGGFAAYGCRKDPENKNALGVDEEAAEAVRNIYECFLNGMSKNAIVRSLNVRERGLQLLTKICKPRNFVIIGLKLIALEPCLKDRVICRKDTRDSTVLTDRITHGGFNVRGNLIQYKKQGLSNTFAQLGDFPGQLQRFIGRIDDHESGISAAVRPTAKMLHTRLRIDKFDSSVSSTKTSKPLASNSFASREDTVLFPHPPLPHIIIFMSLCSFLTL